MSSSTSHFIDTHPRHTWNKSWLIAPIESLQGASPNGRGRLYFSMVSLVSGLSWVPPAARVYADSRRLSEFCLYLHWLRSKFLITVSIIVLSSPPQALDSCHKALSSSGRQ
ncbi:unnamed protein product [Ectocarpus sp. 12 AP-2014]